MGRPRTNLDNLVEWFERYDTDKEDFLSELSDEELNELHEKIKTLEEAIINEK